ncbi:N-acetylmuramoyl-L-alanine amidase [Arenibacterium halophilum]|uniref:N-acetylmuramoyl-L-alanine amidase n=2 Tax=Arenibacterium halophilum TaxID=2583821 RepID=A0ABY2XGE8_9RHOB|nr:N-acetylmuramoyl-L-alanine amidase [Arenibacterium halophilum]
MNAGRAMWGLVAWVLLALPVAAQGFSALARIDPAASQITEAADGGVQIDLGLQIGVPFRIFTLDEPRRLVMDFREVDWTGLTAADLVQTDRVSSVQYGAYVPGWSRMVAELAAPMQVSTAVMAIDPESAAARLTVALRPVSAQEFAASAGAPHDPQWDLPAPQQVAPARDRDPDAPLVVVLDPGHGGIDPGAEVEDLEEKDLMLRFARELREVLLRSGGFQVVLTRDDDHFVSLERRVSMAHQNGADVFISLHADSLAEGQAHGATVHVLSREASDAASAKLAERHDREDLLSGVDLSNADDQVTDILLDLARQETQPRTEALARSVVDAIAASGGPMNRRPLRRASFSVLKAADIPSILIEIGFMSSPRDLTNLRDPDWRLRMAQAIRAGLDNWRRDDRARKPLVRR